MLYSDSCRTEAVGCHWFFPEQPGRDVRFYIHVGPAHRAWGSAESEQHWSTIISRIGAQSVSCKVNIPNYDFNGQFPGMEVHRATFPPLNISEKKRTPIHIRIIS